MKLDWKVHTPQLLRIIREIPAPAILHQPLNIFGILLIQVAARARELNDPILTSLMLRLTLYSVADPNSEDYDQALVDRLLAEAEAAKGNQDVDQG